MIGSILAISSLLTDDWNYPRGVSVGIIMDEQMISRLSGKEDEKNGELLIGSSLAVSTVLADELSTRYINSVDVDKQMMISCFAYWIVGLYNCVIEMSENEAAEMKNRRDANAWILDTERAPRGNFAKVMITGTSQADCDVSNDDLNIIGVGGVTLFKDAPVLDFDITAKFGEFPGKFHRQSAKDVVKNGDSCFIKMVPYSQSPLLGRFPVRDISLSVAVRNMMYMLDGCENRVIECLNKETAKSNKRSFKYAWVLDKLKAERARRGIFAKVMITGTSQADCAVSDDDLTIIGVGGVTLFKDAPVLDFDITAKFGEFSGKFHSQSGKNVVKNGDSCFVKMVPYSQSSLLGRFPVRDISLSVAVRNMIYMLDCCENLVIECLNKETAESNKRSFKYAWVLDKLKAESKHGNITKLMITGISEADCIFFFTHSITEDFESGISKDGQTREEHALLAFTLGVKQMVCYFNKVAVKDLKCGNFAASSTDVYHTVECCEERPNWS